MLKVWNYGGGTQTAAIAVCIVKGVLPVPDIAVFADTSRENTSTWEYLNDVMQPYLSQVGVTVEIAWRRLSTVDLYAKSGQNLLPMYTQTGKLRTFCSGEWKRSVVERYLRQERGVKECEQWFGFSFDERSRCFDSRVQWSKPRFPLVDLKITRDDCEAIIKAAGLPLPQKSSCWMCPHKRAEQWQYIRDNYPADFLKACELERQLHADDEQGGVWLTKHRKFLDEVNIDEWVESEKREKTGHLFGDERGCVSGMCWT